VQRSKLNYAKKKKKYTKNKRDLNHNL